MPRLRQFRANLSWQPFCRPPTDRQNGPLSDRHPHLTSLRELHLDNTDISDAGLQHLDSLRSLRELHLSGTNVTDAGLAHLRGFTGLKWLSLANTDVTDDGIAEIRQQRPNCWLTATNRRSSLANILRSGDQAGN
jgi:hypothetical protein